MVLIAVGDARDKANDKAIMSNMLTIRNQANLYFDTTGAGSFGATTTSPSLDLRCSSGMFTGDETMAKAVAKLQTYISPDHIVCNATNNTFAVAARLKSFAGYFCIDSTSAGKLIKLSDALDGLYGDPNRAAINNVSGLCN